MARDDQIDDGTVPAGRNGPPLFLILLIAVAAVAASFVAQNRERVRINFLLFDFNSRTWTAILVAILLGVVLDRLFLTWWRRARRKN